MNTYRFFAGLLGFMLLCPALTAQQPDFFSYVNEETAELPPQAQQRFDAAKARPTSTSVRLIQLQNLETLASRQQLRIPLPGIGAFDATATKIEQPDSSAVRWSGVMQDNKSRLFFTVVDGDVTGMIHTERAVFTIVPLGSGHHALIHLDQSKFAECANTGSENKPDEDPDLRRKLVKPGRESSIAGISTHTTIDVMVAYTPAVANASAISPVLFIAVFNQPTRSSTTAMLTHR